MANETLTILKDDARLKVIGNSYPDSLTNSGEGLDIPQIIIDILTDLDIDLPDIDPDDWDDLPIVIGLDEDDVPVIEFPDPDFDPDLHPGELPDIIDWPLPDLDWDDLIDGLEDLDIDPGILTDLNFTGLDADGLPSLVNIDTDFKVYVDDLPASIAVVFPPNKTSYTQGQVIDITGLYVYAYKADGTVWRGSERIGDRYRSGRVPNGELIIEPKIAQYYDSKTLNGNVGANQAFAQETGYGLNRTYVKGNNNDPSFGAVFLRDNLCLDPILVSTTAAGTGYNWSGGANAIQYNGATYYWSAYGGLFPSSGGHVVWALAQLGGPMSAQAAALQILAMAGAHGSDVPGQMAAIVSWPRPGDGLILSTSFTITVEQGHGGGR